MDTPKVIELMVDIFPVVGLCDEGGKSIICQGKTENPCVPPTKLPECDPGTKTSICQAPSYEPCVPPTRLPQCKPGSRSTICKSNTLDPVDFAGLNQLGAEPLDAATALLLLKSRLRDELAQRAILS